MEIEFCNAVRTLHSATDNVSRKAASEWLESFEKTDDAWSVATSIISSSEPSIPIEARVFSSQVLRHKVIKDLFKCDPEMVLRIRDALLNILSNPVHPSIAIQICCALAELAIHFPKWENPVETMHQLLARDTRTFNLFLEFMKVLPEELTRNERVFTRGEYADRFTSLLELNATSFFQSLVQSFSSDVDFETKKKLLDCLESWMSIHAFPITLLMNSPILQLAFDGIHLPELFDTSICILSNIFELAHHEITLQTQVGLQLVQISLPRLLQTTRHFLPLVEEDEEMAKLLMKLVSSACNAFLPLILIQPNQFLELLQAMLNVTRLSFLDCIPICLTFWFHFTEALSDPEYVQFDGCLTIVLALVDTLLFHLRYPEEWFDWTAKEKDDFREFRHHIGDLLKSCFYTAGQTCILEKMLSMLKQAQTNWRDTEKILFGLRTMAAVVDPTDNLVLPHIMELVCHLPQPEPSSSSSSSSSMPSASSTTSSSSPSSSSSSSSSDANHISSLPSKSDSLSSSSSSIPNSSSSSLSSTDSSLAYPILLFFGSYSRWTSLHPTYLPIQMQWISKSLSIHPSAAAKAFRHIAEDCASHLVGYLDALEPFYQHSFQLSKSEGLQITEGMARILNEVQNDSDVNAYRLRLTDILIQQLDTHHHDITVLNSALYKLAIFVDLLHVQHPICSMQLMEACWSSMTKVLELYPKEDLITEGVCKILRASLHVETVPYFTEGFIDLLLQLLVSYYQSTLFSCWLWIGSHVIDKLRKKASMKLDVMVHQMMEVTLSLPMDQYTLYFEVLDEFFGVLVTFLHCSSDSNGLCARLPSSILFMAFQALHCSTHPGTIESILYFCLEYVSLGGRHGLTDLFEVCVFHLILGVSQERLMDRYLGLLMELSKTFFSEFKDPDEMLYFHLNVVFTKQLPTFLSLDELTSTIQEVTQHLKAMEDHRLMKSFEKLGLVYARRIQRK